MDTHELLLSYQAETFRNRGHDWADFVAEAHAEPGEIADEAVEHAEATLPEADTAGLWEAAREWAATVSPEPVTPDHAAALALLPQVGAEVWHTVADEMAEHDVDTAADYWRQFVWYLRFLSVGGGDTGMALADQAASHGQ